MTLYRASITAAVIFGSLAIAVSSAILAPAIPTSRSATQAYRTFMKVYYSGGDSNDVINFSGYAWAYTLAYVLKQCGDVLTRENLTYQATHILFQCGLVSAS
jgi:hypothetical protein